MINELDLAAVRADLAKRIGEAVLATSELDEDSGEVPAGMVTRFVVVAEMMPNDSQDRWLVLRDGDALGGTLSPWETVGLLQTAIDYELGQ